MALYPDMGRIGRQGDGSVSTKTPFNANSYSDIMDTMDPIVPDEINEARRSRNAIMSHSADYENYRNQARDALTRSAYDNGALNAARGAQDQFQGEMFKAMVGNVPSAAQIRGQAEQDRAVNQGMGALSAGLSPGQALRAGLGVSNQAGIQANAAATAQRAAEMQRAQGAYQDYTKGVQKQDLDTFLEQQRLNSQLATTYEGMGADLLTQQALAAQEYDRMMNEQMMNKQRADFGYWEGQAGQGSRWQDVLGAAINAGGNIAGQYFGRGDKKNG